MNCLVCIDFIKTVFTVHWTIINQKSIPFVKVPRFLIAFNTCTSQYYSSVDNNTCLQIQMQIWNEKIACFNMFKWKKTYCKISAMSHNMNSFSRERSEQFQNGFILCWAADNLSYKYAEKQIIRLYLCIFCMRESTVFFASPANWQMTWYKFESNLSMSIH